MNLSTGLKLQKMVIETQIANKVRVVAIAAVALAVVLVIGALRSDQSPFAAQKVHADRMLAESPSEQVVEPMPATFGSAGRLGKLGELAEHPEAFAHSPANPFACPPNDGGPVPCLWEFDPTVARSPAEAEWMALQGYPTLAQRQWAKTQTTETVLLEARRTGSPALWTLGLERAVIESTSIDVAAKAVLELDRVANNFKSLYALERQGVLQAHLIEMTVMKGGWSPVNRELRGVIDTALVDARSAGVRAAVLGDGAAMQRVHDALQRIPGISDSPLGEAVNRGQVHRLGGDISLFHRELQRNAAEMRAGRPLPYGGFTLADIRPRPTQSNVVGDGRPGGQWIEF